MRCFLNKTIKDPMSFFGIVKKFNHRVHRDIFRNISNPTFLPIALNNPTGNIF
jgi:hypothetical protein